MNAQIEYVTTLKNVSLEFSHYVEPLSLAEFGEFIYSVDEAAKTITLYDDQFKADKVVTIPNVSQALKIDVIWPSIGLFTTDDKICFFVIARFGDWDNGTYKFMVLNENGIVVESFKKEYSIRYWPTLFSMDGNMYVAIMPEKGIPSRQGDADADTDIYLLPSTTTDLNIPVRQINARKVVENGQMYIILDGVKYAVTGSSM